MHSHRAVHHQYIHTYIYICIHISQICKSTTKCHAVVPPEQRTHCSSTFLSNKQHWTERYGTPRLCVVQPSLSKIKQTMQMFTDSLWMYIYIHMCMCVYIYIYIYTHTHTHAHTHTYIYISIYIYIYMYVCIYMYICMYVHIYIYICVQC